MLILRRFTLAEAEKLIAPETTPDKETTPGAPPTEAAGAVTTPTLPSKLYTCSQ